MTRKLPQIFCAIDTPDQDAALVLAAAMQEAGCGIKLGLEFFCARGPDGIKKIRDLFPELPLFLDLKFHDIPNTAAGAVRSATALAPAFMTIHASGGTAMMRAAQDAAQDEAAKRGFAVPALLAVTVLTALDNAALSAVGQKTPSETQALLLATLTKETGLLGIVCAGPDIATIRGALGSDFILMVPGIRPAGSGAQDQKRVMTPAEALRHGATHLVIGRPITETADPAQTARTIRDSLTTD
ncbi:MAG: orotidine-5'-phosphate decarboxylase [Micavibrio sp.]